MSELRLVLRYLQHEGGLGKKSGKVKLDDLAEALDITRDQLNRFLSQMGNKGDLKERHHIIANQLYPILLKKQKLPPHIKAMMSDIYGEGAFPASEAVVTTDRVIGHRSLIPAANNAREIINPLEGLNALVRPANEVVPAPTEQDPMAVTRGWSVSILNIPPKHVQEGDHHPVFKIRQIGQGNNEMLIEGVVIAKPDRIVLQGMTLGETRTVQAIITVSPEKSQQYRPAGEIKGNATPKTGLFNGVSSGGSAFGCLFKLFAIPGSTLTEPASEEGTAQFRKTYDLAKEVAGVRDLAGTVSALSKLGIATDQDTLMELAKRSTLSPILSAF